MTAGIHMLGTINLIAFIVIILISLGLLKLKRKPLEKPIIPAENIENVAPVANEV